MRDNTNTNPGRKFKDMVKESLAFLWGKFFGVNKQGVLTSRGKDNSSSNDRAGKGASADFI
jgi:hypothetical protein